MRLIVINHLTALICICIYIYKVFLFLQCSMSLNLCAFKHWPLHALDHCLPFWQISEAREPQNKLIEDKTRLRIIFDVELQSRRRNNQNSYITAVKSLHHVSFLQNVKVCLDFLSQFICNSHWSPSFILPGRLLANISLFIHSPDSKWHVTVTTAYSSWPDVLKCCGTV